MRRTGGAGDGYHGHLRGFVLVLHPLRQPKGRQRGLRYGGGALLASRGPVHRGHRARHHAPALLPILHQGPQGPGTGGVRRALHQPTVPGDGGNGRSEDEQVQGQRDHPGPVLRGLRGGHPAPVHPLPGTARDGQGMERFGDRRRPPFPPPRLAPGGQIHEHPDPQDPAGSRGLRGARSASPFLPTRRSRR